MKMRSGFVSNSSSTSFTCEICGATESGWDMCLSELGWFECENGHILCDTDANEGAEEYSSEELDNEDDGDEDYDEGYLPEKFCPICCMDVISDGDQKRYLKKITGITEAEVFEQVKAGNKRRKKLYDSEYVAYALNASSITYLALYTDIRNKFSTYAEFREFIRETVEYEEE